jgi:hypothetical protein
VTDDVESIDLAAVDPQDLLIAEVDGILVLNGPDDAIERFRDLHPELHRATPLPSTSAVIGAAVDQLAGLATRPDATQQLFHLDEKGLELFKNGQLAQARTGDGWLRAFGKGSDGGITGQAAIKPVLMAPEQVLTAQLALTTVALTAAIKEVQKAVERVEGKLDSLNDLVTSMLVGNVLGAHEALARRAEQTLITGSMADADWATIQGIGVEVEQQIATIRTFVRKRLKAALDEGMGVKDRRDALEQVGQITEVLGLLAVAQHSLFLFQAARLQRLRSHEPDHLQAAMVEAKELLELHAAEDRALLDQCRGIVSDRLQVEALELYRYLSARDVVRLSRDADESLGWFASQRTLAYEALPPSVLPTFGEAYDELKTRGVAVADGARTVADVARVKLRRPKQADDA